MQDAFDLSQAEILRSPDVRGWQATRAITAAALSPSAGFSLAFDRALPDSWKWASNPNVASENFQFTVWFFVNYGGRWHGAGFVQMWQGRPFENNAVPSLLDDPGFAVLWGNQGSALAGVFGNYQPAGGDQVGIMVSAGNARGVQDVTSVAERSNVVLVTLPDRGRTGSWSFPDQAQPAPDPKPGDPAPQPSTPVDMAAINARFDRLELALVNAGKGVSQAQGSLAKQLAALQSSVDSLTVAARVSAGAGGKKKAAKKAAKK